jgi:hypothetical protein
MIDILANFSAALIFCYFFIKEKVGNVSTFDGFESFESLFVFRYAGRGFKV